MPLAKKLENFEGAIAMNVCYYDFVKAKRRYGSSQGEPEEFITILELPPVTDAQGAVKVGVSYQIKKTRKGMP